MNSVVLVLSAKVNNPKSIFKPYATKLEDYDVKFLCSTERDKILKKDIDLDFDELEAYDVVCPVGAEALKYICKITGITKYNGIHIEKRYVPIIHPGLIEFRPQYKEEIIKAFNKIAEVLKGDYELAGAKKDYRFVDTLDEFDEYLILLEKEKEPVVDIETTSLSPRKGSIIGVAFSTQINEGVFVTSEVIKARLPQLKKALKGKTAIFHNAKFDMSFLKYEYDLEFDFFDDTMLLHYCLEEALGTHGLKQLALRFTDLGDYERELDDYKKAFCRKNKILLKNFNYGMFPIEILSPYACKDGDGTKQLHKKFKPIVTKSDKFSFVYNKILLPATKAIMKMENNGGPIDRKAVMALKRDYEIDIEECRNEIYEYPEVARYERINGKTFNPNSYPQLREILFNYIGLKPLKKTDGGEWSTDAETLESLKHPLPECILDMRSKTKLLGTYVDNILEGLDEDDRLRSNFNIQGTVAGRLSSSGTLNYQNIPRDNKDIKKLFVARPGFKILQGDLGTAEVYYAAVLSKDKFLQKAFIDGLDFHGYVAKQMFNLPCEVEEVKEQYPNERQYAKAITFGIMYQAGPGKIADEINASKDMKPEDYLTYQDAKVFINKYFREASSLKTFIDRNNNFIENHHYIYSFFGRKRRLPESRSTNQGVRKHAVRSGVNFLIQSVASDINLLGFIDIMDWIEEKRYAKDIVPFTLVHDSIVVEIRDELIDEYVNISRDFIQTDRGISIPNCPIKVDYEVGPSWGELHKYAA